MWKNALLMLALILLTAVISVSTHVFIIQYFQPPEFKINAQADQIIGYTIRWCTVVGAMFIFIGSIKYWEKLKLFYRIILFALLIMALTEQLLRSFIMQVVIGYPWRLQGLSLISTYIAYLVLSLVISFCVPILSRAVNWKFLKYFGFSVLTTALVFFTKKIANYLISSFTSLIPPPDMSKIIHLPYDMKVLIPAYITFLEPTIASFIVFCLIKDKLKNFPTLLQGLIMGSLISITHAGVYSIVQILNSHGNLIYRTFYYGQFLWEYFTLGILVAYSFFLYRKACYKTQSVRTPHPEI